MGEFLYNIFADPSRHLVHKRPVSLLAGISLLVLVKDFLTGKLGLNIPEFNPWMVILAGMITCLIITEILYYTSTNLCNTVLQIILFIWTGIKLALIEVTVANLIPIKKIVMQVAGTPENTVNMILWGILIATIVITFIVLLITKDEAIDTI